MIAVVFSEVVNGFTHAVIDDDGTKTTVVCKITDDPVATYIAAAEG